jgi:hypothetical protein
MFLFKISVGATPVVRAFRIADHSVEESAINRSMNNIRVFVIGCTALLFTCAQTSQGANDRQLEDAVANKFFEIRAGANLPRLSRIRSRAEVEEITCTAASFGGIRNTRVTVYQTSDPTIPSPELRRLALHETPEGKAGYTRFAVAVWPVRGDKSAAEKSYWVGIKLYLSPIWELLTYTMTDDIGHQNDWTKDVSSNCRGMH